ncbi:DUF5104 domain-containing protein [Dehalobacterium formicoaceticum]|uniref:DUF5104 domain-containing protein n=1 Tax=Dehalobacterium formicoaceticum TaxID=51515 RepID=A0ABT1Y7D4_9FIRM|nr:DUF5104 domain-containing protein [Dehalobacterium formicoaceticum]MCR6546792.1 DUF5104 domain-containing protein [Dehalobacterium formicoaceticum]
MTSITELIICLISYKVIYFLGKETVGPLNQWMGEKRSLMIRFDFDIKTDKDDYGLFVIDYNVDTINPDNEGGRLHVANKKIRRLE